MDDGGDLNVVGLHVGLCSIHADVLPEPFSVYLNDQARWDRWEPDK